MLDEGIDGLAWLAEERNLRSVRKLISKLCRYDGQHARDDAWGECVDRVQSCCDTYDPHHPSGATLRTHVLGNLRWYIWKLRRGPRHPTSRLGEREPAYSERSPDDSVELLPGDLDGLLVLLRTREGLTIRQVARLVEEPVSTVFLRCRRAMTNVRARCLKTG